MTCLHWYPVASFHGRTPLQSCLLDLRRPTTRAIAASQETVILRAEDSQFRHRSLIGHALGHASTCPSMHRMPSNTSLATSYRDARQRLLPQLVVMCHHRCRLALLTVNDAVSSPTLGHAQIFLNHAAFDYASQHQAFRHYGFFYRGSLMDLTPLSGTEFGLVGDFSRSFYVKRFSRCMALWDGSKTVFDVLTRDSSFQAGL